MQRLHANVRYKYANTLSVSVDNTQGTLYNLGLLFYKRKSQLLPNGA